MKKILIIDDEEDILEVVSMRLQKHGHQVACARSGEEGLACLEKNKPDLILLDIRLPNSNGYEICQKIRRMPDLKKIPVLFFTAGNQDGKVLDMCEKTGAQGFIMKPFDGDQLIKKINGHLPRAA